MGLEGHLLIHPQGLLPLVAAVARNHERVVSADHWLYALHVCRCTYL